jgi:hypothetical protein
MDGRSPCRESGDSKKGMEEERREKRASSKSGKKRGATSEPLVRDGIGATAQRPECGGNP